MTDPNIGRLLANRYQLQELIGTGAMGRVYYANDVLLGGVPVAIKFLALSIQNPKFRLRERFEREAKTCALLGQKSIQIVRVMDYGVDENATPFYVMEYLQGKSLSDLIRLQPLSLARFLSLARQISLGLQCAHQGIPIEGEICPIIHRDIKPTNILVIQDLSFGELVKILDFGIAKLLQANSDQTTYYLGTLAYSSPEQMEGKELDPRSDIYSLGIMLFEMLTGKMPIQADTASFGGWYKAHHFQTPRSFASTDGSLKLPPELENLVMSCLAKAPGDRPQTTSEIVQTLVSLEQRYGAFAPAGQRIEEAIAKQPVTTEVKSDEPSQPQTKQQPSDTSQHQRSASVSAAKPEALAKPQAPSEAVSGAPAINQRRSETLGVNVSDSKGRLLSADEVCQLTSWPKNKPIADIVFPHPIRTKSEVMAALWIMLPQKEIEKFLQSKRYNQFVFVTSPHPMMLWITVLHNHEHGPKWLPYYLDLKPRQGQEITQLLGQTGCYRLLLFARESPQRPYACQLLTIAPAQRQRLQQWAITSQSLVSADDPQFSKNLLKKEFEKIKPQILSKLETLNTNFPLDLSS